jgi:hypothetical protein
MKMLLNSGMLMVLSTPGKGSGHFNTSRAEPLQEVHRFWMHMFFALTFESYLWGLKPLNFLG